VLLGPMSVIASIALIDPAGGGFECNRADYDNNNFLCTIERLESSSQRFLGFEQLS
jgi:hypothetical protein